MADYERIEVGPSRWWPTYATDPPLLFACKRCGATIAVEVNYEDTELRYQHFSAHETFHRGGDNDIEDLREMIRKLKSE